MAVTTTYSWDYVSQTGLAPSFITDNAATASLSFSGGYIVLGDHVGHIDGFIYNADGGYVGTFPSISGTLSAVTELTNGNIVITTQDADSILYTILNSTGSTVLATTDIGNVGSTNADVAALTGGGFAVTFQDQFGPGDSDIFLRIYNEAGGLVTEIAPDFSSSNMVNPSIVGLSDGNIAVAWTRINGAETEIYVAIYTAAGATVQAPTLFDTLGTVNDHVDMVAYSGSFAIVYEDNGWFGSNNDITLARISNNGTFNPFTGYTNISANGIANSSPSITILSNGMLAVSYSATQFVSTIYTALVDIDGTVLATNAQFGGQSILESSINPDISAFGLGMAAVYFTNLNDGVVRGNSIVGVRTSVGDAGNDTVTGDDLRDIMNGGAGNDYLSGINGNDSLVGGLGDDTLEGGVGVDFIDGGDGNDTVAVGDSIGETVLGGAGDDTLFYFPSGSFGGTVDGGDGQDTLFVDSETLGTIIDLEGGTLQNISGFATLLNTEHVNTINNLANFSVYGSTLANLIQLGDGFDFVDASLGDDTVSGGYGNDTLNGGDGNDSIDIDGGFEDDTLNGGTGADSIGSAANLISAMGADVVHGDDGDDVIYANATSGGSYFGDGGNDIIHIGDGVSTMDGGADIDTFDATNFDNDYAVNMVTGVTNFGGESLVNFENAITGGGNDTITGTAGANSIITNDGNDTIFAGAGDDTVRGGNGADSLNGGTGTDTLDYTDSTFGVTVNLATNSATGGTATGDVIASFENVLGSFENDSLTGTIGNNVLSGSDGFDTLIGGNGLDTLYGGNDADSLVGGGGADSMIGGGEDDIYVTQESGDQVIELAGGGMDLVQGWGNTTLSDWVENLTLFGTALNGTGNNLDNSITGNANNNSLLGGDGNDMIDGAGGNDVLKGEGGDDALIGSVGADTLNGGLGDDTMTGGLGNDLYIVEQPGDVISEAGGGGVDTVQINANYTLLAGFENLTLVGVAVVGTGNSSNNLITGNFSSNQLDGAAGNDTINAGGGSDSVLGGTGADVLSGEAGLDTLRGGDQNDTLDGGAGNDTLFGDAAGDVLTGGIGTDVVTGGAGADQFLFDDGHMLNSIATADRITDFTAAQLDRIDLLQIDADSSTGADDSFTFIDTAAFSGVAGQLRTFTNAGNTFIAGDVNGDGVGDFLIRLDGIVTLNAGNFVL